MFEWSSSMLETVKYLLGSAGPSGYGSKSTAEQVTDRRDLRSITAIITETTRESSRTTTPSPRTGSR